MAVCGIDDEVFTLMAENNFGKVEESRQYISLKDGVFSHGQFSLRSIKDSDIQQVRVWRNSQIDVLRQSKPITELEQVEYFARSVWPQMQINYPDNILLAFEFNGELVGYGGLVHISWVDLRSEISFLLNPSYIQNDKFYVDYFSAFLRLINKVAFSELGFNRIFTETFDCRTRHISVLESEGFILEGIMRKHIIVDGKPISSLIHGCLNNDAR